MQAKTSALQLLALVVFMSGYATAADFYPTVEFKITVSQADTSATVTGRALFPAPYAISVLDEKDPQGNYVVAPVVFDLEDKAWYEEKAKQWITANQQSSFLMATLRQTRKSLENVTDERLRGFVEESISPDFEVTEEGKMLKITGNYIRYSIRRKKVESQTDLERWINYDRLNAIHKSMTERKLPPYAQLKVDDILLQYGAFPSVINASISTPVGDVTMKVESATHKPTPEEIRIAEEAVAALPAEQKRPPRPKPPFAK